MMRQIHSLRWLLEAFGFVFETMSHDELNRRLWVKEDDRSPLFRNVYWFLQGRRNHTDDTQASDHQVVYWITGWEGRESVEFRKIMCELLGRLAHDADCGCDSCYSTIMWEVRSWRTRREGKWLGAPDVPMQGCAESSTSKVLRIHLKLANPEPSADGSAEPRPGEVESCDSP
jgi:hypothetical protein